jgi:PAP2 superfamily
MAGATSATWTATRRRARPWARALRPWAKEITLILLLYSLWQYAGAWSIGRASAALARGQAIWHAERMLHLPSERAAQALILPHRSLVHWLNVYYALVHVPALGLCLVWLFVRHRDRYPQVRTVVALVTGASLIIQLIPVAPPRLLPHLGIVDTAAVVGPSVYSRGAPGMDQLAAMPSLHVGWALIVGGSIVWVTRHRWRWLALGYPALTMFTVVATGNHFWADGIAAAGLCALAAVLTAKAYGTPAPLATAADVPVLASVIPADHTTSRSVPFSTS